MFVRERVAFVHDLKDGEMKEVSVGGGKYKLLLSRINGTFYATSALCTHFKAPLVKGSLSKDGRLLCPWHAACFNVRTGDIEEAPGIGGLQSFGVEIVNETEVFVTVTDESQLQTTSRPVCRAFEGIPDQSHSMVIVGGGAAGAIAAESIRKEGYKGSITLVSREPYLPIDRVRLSKALDLATDPSAFELFKQTYWEEVLKVNLLLGRSAISLDTKESLVILDDQSKLPYNQLLLAMGGVPRRLPMIPGSIGLSNIHVLRSLTDLQAIRSNFASISSSIDRPVEIVIVGNSFIGMEMAATLAKSKIAASHITVLGSTKVAFERTLGSEVGAVFEQLHRSNGINFCQPAKLVRFEGEEGGPVRGVVYECLTDFRLVTLPADLVILGVGVKPQTDFLVGILPLEPDGSVLVNLQMQVASSGSGNIFAAGDLVTFPFQSSLRLEHWNVAQQQGRIAGTNMARMAMGSKDAPARYDTVPFFWTMQYGKSLRMVGSNVGYQNVLIRGDPANYCFEAFYLRQDEEIIAVATMGMDPVAVHTIHLMRANKMPSIAEIRAGKLLLDCNLF